MTINRENRIRRRRRILLWVLGGTVVLFLAIIVSQQLWLWTVVRPDTPPDAVMLYALSTLNFVAFVVFIFISFLPITAMAVFSYLFLNRSLEKWFNPFPDEIAQQAAEVKRATLATQEQTLRDTASLL